LADLLIRPANGQGDLVALQGLFRAYGDHLAQGPGAICIENFDREIAGLPGPYAAILLATVDCEVAGCVALKTLAQSSEQACEMKRLWVDGQYRGLGLGRKLILAALDHAKATGHNAIYLDTVPAAMPEANRLYASLGFEEVPRYNTNPVANVVFFRRTL